MKVVLCSNAFKECLSAREASEAMREGVRKAAPAAECVVIPLADGGDSTLEVLVEQRGGEFRTIDVTGPLGKKLPATYGLIKEGETITAVIEMAKASGLALIDPSERDALRTSTRGTGELMLDALNAGAHRIVLCIGGSATNEGGAGAAYALGFRFFDKSGAEVPPVGGRLRDIFRIDDSHVHPLLRSTEVVVACDVTNPLCGERGATAVYGPQKGATTPEQRAVLEEGLQNLGRLWTKLPGVPADLPSRAGAGAAGGLGGGAMAFFGATLKSGFDLVADLSGLTGHLRGASFAITGEGRIDEQTGSGKVPHGVAVRCGEMGVPLTGIFGGIRNVPGILEVPQLGDAAIFSLCNGPIALKDAMDPSNAKRLIAAQAFMVTRLFLMGRASSQSRPKL